jgi:PEP-CTERM motif
MAGLIVDQSTLRTGSGGRFSKEATVWALVFLIAVGLVAIPRKAAADTFPLNEFGVTLGTPIFDDSFGQVPSLSGGSGAVVSSGVNFLAPPGAMGPANYFVVGTIPEATANNGQALLNPTNGITIHQPDPFIPVIQIVSAALQSGTLPTMPHTLLGGSSGNTFTVTGLFDLTVPSVILGTYDIMVTNNSPTTPGNFLQLRVRDCSASIAACAGFTGPILQYAWLNFATNQFTQISAVPLIPPPGATQLELELTKPSATSDDIIASYLFCNGNTSATCTGSFTPLGTSGASTDVFTSSAEWVVPGFQAFQPAPVPEPASLLLLGVGCAALAGFRTRRSNREEDQRTIRP